VSCRTAASSSEAREKRLGPRKPSPGSRDLQTLHQILGRPGGELARGHVPVERTLSVAIHLVLVFVERWTSVGASPGSTRFTSPVADGAA
jgi:hypothetical protein